MVRTTTIFLRNDALLLQERLFHVQAKTPTATTVGLTPLFVLFTWLGKMSEPYLHRPRGIPTASLPPPIPLTLEPGKEVYQE